MRSERVHQYPARLPWPLSDDDTGMFPPQARTTGVGPEPSLPSLVLDRDQFSICYDQGRTTPPDPRGLSFDPWSVRREATEMFVSFSDWRVTEGERS